MQKTPSGSGAARPRRVSSARASAGACFIEIQTISEPSQIFPISNFLGITLSSLLIMFSLGFEKLICKMVFSKYNVS